MSPTQRASVSANPSVSAAVPSGAAPQADSLGTRLFRQAQQGDRGAFGQFSRLYQDRLYNAMLRMVGNPDDALELTQDTFTRALVNLDSFRGDAAPYTWLFRIAVNQAMSSIRVRKPAASLNGKAGGHAGNSGSGNTIADRLADGGAGPDEVAERRERTQQVLAALDRVAADHRVVLVMRDVEGFDYQQMAQVLNLSLNTLKSKIFRARMALRDELAAYMKE